MQTAVAPVTTTHRSMARVLAMDYIAMIAVMASLLQMQQVVVRKAHFILQALIRAVIIENPSLGDKAVEAADLAEKGHMAYMAGQLDLAHRNRLATTALAYRDQVIAVAQEVIRRAFGDSTPATLPPALRIVYEAVPELHKLTDDNMLG